MDKKFQENGYRQSYFGKEFCVWGERENGKKIEAKNDYFFLSLLMCVVCRMREKKIECLSPSTITHFPTKISLFSPPFFLFSQQSRNPYCTCWFYTTWVTYPVCGGGLQRNTQQIIRIDERNVFRWDPARGFAEEAVISRGEREIM